MLFYNMRDFSHLAQPEHTPSEWKGQVVSHSYLGLRVLVVGGHK